MGAQESVVQTFPSLQSNAAPGRQTPPRQRSSRVHAFRSSQAVALGVLMQPSCGSQESSVQTFPSSQSTVSPERQVPPAQMSFTEQTSPSVQVSMLDV